MENTLFARQAIYDQDINVVAYELLFRDGDADVDNNNLLEGALIDLELDTVVGSQKAFINFTRHLLLNGVPNTLSADRVVIELLKNRTIDDDLYTSVARLANQGYQLAVDDFVFHKNLASFVELASIIKFDVLNKSEDEIKTQLDSVSVFKGKLLAEKIKDYQQYEMCKNLGFDYFQGPGPSLRVS